MPAFLVLGAECDVAGILDGCAHDHVVHGEGRFATEGGLLRQAHLAVTLCRPVVVACGRAGLMGGPDFRLMREGKKEGGDMGERGTEAEVWY